MAAFVIPAVSTHPGFRFAAGEAGIQSAIDSRSRVKPGMTVGINPSVST